MKQRTFVRRICRGAIFGALYVALTFVSSAFGLSSGVIQLRLSEMLCVLPLFAPEAVWGLTVGCFVANLITGALWQDVVFGSLATLLGALGAWAFCRAKGWVRYLSPIPTVIANALIVPTVLIYAYGIEGTWWFFALTVGLGELISAGVFGAMQILLIDKRLHFVFKK